MEQHLGVSNSCSNNCGHCRWRGAAPAADPLAGLKPRGGPLVVYGGEPVLRRDFFAMLPRLSRAAGAGGLALVTNGRVFSSADITAYAIKLGVGHFFVKAPAFRRETYISLCGSDGLAQANAGLTNIAAAGQERLNVIIPVLAGNLAELPDIACAVSTLGPRRALFDLRGIKLDKKIKELLGGLTAAFAQDRIDARVITSGANPQLFNAPRAAHLFRQPARAVKLPAPGPAPAIPSGGAEYFQTGSDPRALPPERTVKNVKKIIGRTTFSRVKPLCQGKGGIYVYEFKKSRPESPHSLPAQFGKGFDRHQALASGYMEIIERFSGVIRPAEKARLVYARYADVAGRAVDPALFPITQPAPFYNAKGARLAESYLPSYMDNAWAWSYSLTKGRHVLAPAALIYQGFTSEKGRHFLHSKSVGLASGNTMEEAVIHGVNEWFESEALNSLPKPLPFSALDRVPEADLAGAAYLPAELRRAGAAVFCFYLGNSGRSIKLHTFLPSVFINKGEGSYTIISGLACNLDPANALKRAVSELLEICLRRGVDLFAHPGIMRKSAAYRPRNPVDLARLKNYSAGSVHRDYLAYRKMLDKAGLELLVNDLTRPELGIPVARVLIPGLKLTLLADSLTFAPDSLAFFK
jgi:YcaO-like protein with predicted kinase domain